MRIAILLYDRFTALDAIGPYESLGHLPGWEPVFVAERPGPVANETGNLRLVAEAALEEVPDPDIVLVPGSPFCAAQQTNSKVLAWLRRADATSTWTTSVCSGSVILAAAGLLQGRRATTHWAFMEELAALGAEPVEERYVFDGKYVTSAGVSAGIDMGLALSGRIAGDEVAQVSQLLMQYDPEPPYGAGSPQTAPPEVLAKAVEVLRATL
ncbi:DJ-1/PfpI family protein [Streptomyces sp. P1-3]|uniref:DJ-1/PfpI family protein n=1 Tax=Streptomyces sp. P1-3 TaxID=3421658 RepID=UPI003D364AA0